ncbi:GAF domain-containing sensor histidine kinase [Crocosphaera sp. UHCC 0190]|uniref:GAF domain-containing sensor histidine kinase n=1 Tax=Crocosphaera sp. UHCC 0190 TaxID=3110246 RepID=UPI002B218114|nr:GAF domain-containing sensor histidine kinase [Crocosphaera sp. UHCC 0190]MEA5511422.1 GAF domain-containing sensor histidine kinase [Crocosphaera sp. UHCC 0190]
MQVQAVNLGVNVSMLSATNRLFCRLDGLSPAVREQKRVNTLKQLGLLDTETIPIFEEATQTAARFIEAPICILGTMVKDDLWLKSAVGLSRLGLMNQLASSRRIPRQEAFSTYIVDSEQPLVINDTLQDPIFARSALVQHYGIRAFLGTPLITAEGECIGALGVMDLVPRQFTPRDLEFLTLTARWCLREFERNHLLKRESPQDDEWLTLAQPNLKVTPDNEGILSSTAAASISSIKLKLLRQLIEELRTPLTSVIGMSSVLQGGIFGSLSHKQKEYLEIIHNSGQQMNSLVKEIFKLGMTNDNLSQLHLNPVNIEMLSQQAINSLCEVANQKRQTLRLSVEPGKRIWLLDKEILRQALYYLMISVLESSEVGGEIRVHVSRRSKTLNIAVWVSHPWLGDGLPQVNLYPSSNQHELTQLHNSLAALHQGDTVANPVGDHVLSASSLEKMIYGEQTNQLPGKSSQELLGLLLSCYLTESHGGKIIVQGSPESGYRYVLMLPKISTEEKI